MKKYLVILVFAAAVFWYLPGAGLGYVCDDFYYLQGIGLPEIIGLHSNLENIDSAAVNVFRPIPMAILGIWVNLNLAPWVPHLWNILIHALNCVLVLILFRQYFSVAVSFGGAMLWMLFPGHAEAVYTITGIFALTFTTCAMLFLTAVRMGRFKMALVSMAAGLLCYEQAFSLCLMMPLIWRRRGWWFAGLTVFIGIIRYLILGGVGVYGWDYAARMIDPLNWIQVAGYYLQMWF